MGEEHSPNRDRPRRSGLRALIEPRCLSPFGRSDGGDGVSGAGRRLVYLKLPPQRLIKLTVVKLDGSLFDVEIAKDGSVAELKRAVEEVFTVSPQEGQSMISWSHVWGHFCLCYQGQKLVMDKESIQSLGINDGDQLHFVRHMSIGHSPLQRGFKNRNCNTNQNNGEDIPESCYPGAQDELPVSEFSVARFFKGWLTSSRLWGFSKKGPESWSRPSRFSLKRFGGRPKMIQL